VAAILSGALVGLLGMPPCAHLAPRKAELNRVFAICVFVVAGWWPSRCMPTARAAACPP